MCSFHQTLRQRIVAPMNGCIEQKPISGGCSCTNKLMVMPSFVSACLAWSGQCAYNNMNGQRLLSLGALEGRRGLFL